MDSPAPGSGGSFPKWPPDFSTRLLNGQARRIDLIVGYEADEAHVLPHTNANGELVQFKADAHVIEAPVRTMPELYRWLQAQGYIPAGFKWLGWERGLRQRRETYVREAVR